MYKSLLFRGKINLASGKDLEQYTPYIVRTITETPSNNPAYHNNLSPLQKLIKIATHNFSNVSIIDIAANAPILSFAIIAALYGTLRIVIAEEITDK